MITYIKTDFNILTYIVLLNIFNNKHHNSL